MSGTILQATGSWVRVSRHLQLVLRYLQNYFCVAVSSMRQCCHMLVVNYFRCTSGTLLVWVLMRADTNHHERRAIYIQLTPPSFPMSLPFMPILGMPDIQKFFHEALTVIISKLQYLYTRRKLLVSSIECYHFPVECSMCAYVTPIFIFSHTNFN